MGELELKAKRKQIIPAALGAVAITALLCLLATVGGMEQGSIAFGRGCVIGAAMLELFCAAVVAGDAAHRYREAHRQHGRKRGENRA